jgi:hypothetical protein
MLLFVSCTKEVKQDIKYGNVTFYQSDYPIRNSTLFVDNHAFDLLNGIQYFDSTGFIPQCGDKIWPYVETVTLQYGRHSYFVKGGNKTSDTFYVDVFNECQLQKVPK